MGNMVQEDIDTGCAMIVSHRHYWSATLDHEHKIITVNVARSGYTKNRANAESYLKPYEEAGYTITYKEPYVPKIGDLVFSYCHYRGSLPHMIGAVQEIRPKHLMLEDQYNHALILVNEADARLATLLEISDYLNYRSKA